MSIDSRWTRLRRFISQRPGWLRWGAKRSDPASLAETALPEPAETPALEPATLEAPPRPPPTPPPPPPTQVAPHRQPLPRLEIVIPRAPGRFETDTELGIHASPFNAQHKRRAFIVYRPAGWSRELRAPLIVLCHGCKQTPEDFAKGTRIDELADRLGCLVLLPRQTKWANPWLCWNWFDPSMTAGGGEAEIVAAQIRFVRQRYRTDPRRVMAVGISAGAALAAALGLRYPRHVHAVVAHAGIAFGAARSALGARDVMSRGPQADVAAIGVQARAKFGGVLPVPLLAIHGESDTVVAPTNSIALVRQYLHFNAHPAVDETDRSGKLPRADASATLVTADGREMTTREWRLEGRLVARHVSVAGLGHAWSGGDASLAFNDRRAPDSSKLVGDFLSEVLSGNPTIA